LGRNRPVVLAGLNPPGRHRPFGRHQFRPVRPTTVIGPFGRHQLLDRKQSSALPAGIGQSSWTASAFWPAPVNPPINILPFTAFLLSRS
jgi:hypothetical protein